MSEIADVMFQIDKYLSQLNITIEDVRNISIKKTEIKFPRLIEELSCNK